MDYDIANFINLLINTFMCFSSPLNLAVYCSMSNQFRKQFKEIMCPSYANPRGSDQAIIRTDHKRGISMEVSPKCPYLVENKRCYRKRETRHKTRRSILGSDLKTKLRERERERA